MRRIELAIVAGVAAFSLLIGGARWIGQRTAPGVVPLPAGGCWLDVCPFQMPGDLIAGALASAPGVVPGSVQSADGEYAAGFAHMIAFDYQPARAAARPLVLLAGYPGQFIVERDWHSSAMIMRLGDLVAAYGPPDGLYWSVSDGLRLLYGSRRVMVMGYPFRLWYGLNTVRLTPGVYVVQFIVTNPDEAPGTDVVYYPPFDPWRGFTLYRFEDD